jgi:hypothetical protein
MDSTQVSHRNPANLLKIYCVVALAVICFTPNMQANILDDIFQSAAQLKQLKPTSHITIQFAMTQNEITRKNLVAYSVGQLVYYPLKFSRPVFIPATFASDAGTIKQYFSDREYALPPGTNVNNPFDPRNTDPLTVSISRDFLYPNYSITLHSPKWGFNASFTPSFDASTNILYFSWGNTFFTVSLGNPQADKMVQ